MLRPDVEDLFEAEEPKDVENLFLRPVEDGASAAGFDGVVYVQQRPSTGQVDEGQVADIEVEVASLSVYHPGDGTREIRGASDIQSAADAQLFARAVPLTCDVQLVWHGPGSPCSCSTHRPERFGDDPAGTPHPPVEHPALPWMRP